MFRTIWNNLKNFEKEGGRATYRFSRQFLNITTCQNFGTIKETKKHNIKKMSKKEGRAREGLT